MAKIYERLLSTNIPREKSWHSLDAQRVTLLGEDSICMMYKRLLSLITAKRRDRHSFGSSLCNP